MRDVAAADADVLQFALAHRCEQTPAAASLTPSPDPRQHGRRNGKRHRQRRWRPPLPKPALAGQDVAQRLQPAARNPVSGNGPSAFSVKTESQYSLISVILPLA